MCILPLWRWGSCAVGRTNAYNVCPIQWWRLRRCVYCSLRPRMWQLSSASGRSTTRSTTVGCRAAHAHRPCQPWSTSPVACASFCRVPASTTWNAHSAPPELKKAAPPELKKAERETERERRKNFVPILFARKTCATNLRHLLASPLSTNCLAHVLCFNLRVNITHCCQSSCA